MMSDNIADALSLSDALRWNDDILHAILTLEDHPQSGDGVPLECFGTIPPNADDLRHPRRLARHQLHRPRAVALFATQIANALDVLHAQGIVHRDIKPGNIMTRNGRDPVLVDLGYAKRIARSTAKHQSISIEQSRLVGLGTPGYAAPEQFTGEEITPASDIHALGVLLNECFDGKPPRHRKAIMNEK